MLEAQANLTRLFEEKVLSRVSQRYYPDSLLPVLGLELLQEGIEVESAAKLWEMIKVDATHVKDKISETLKQEHIMLSKVEDLKTTEKLASCRIDRWDN